VTIKNFPPELKSQLIAEAEARGFTLNDTIVMILATAFKYPFEPVGRAQRETKETRDLYIALPVGLHKRIKHRAVTRRCWPRELMIETLTAAFASAAA
jgi:hypothetical protein